MLESVDLNFHPFHLLESVSQLPGQSASPLIAYPITLQPRSLSLLIIYQYLFPGSLVDPGSNNVRSRHLQESATD